MYLFAHRIVLMAPRRNQTTARYPPVMMVMPRVAQTRLKSWLRNDERKNEAHTHKCSSRQKTQHSHVATHIYVYNDIFK